MQSNRGPGAIDYSRTTNAGSGAVGGSWGSSSGGVSSVVRPSSASMGPPQSSMVSSGGAKTAVSDGTYEKNIVKDLCPPGGLKPVPPPDKLANFARVCPTLNADVICPALFDSLEEGQPWIMRAKALCAMEAAIANGTKLHGTNPYRDFFHACVEEISPLVSHARSAIHEPAKRVLSLLGHNASASAPATAPPVAAAAPVPNLLDFDEPAPAALVVIDEQLKLYCTT